MVPLIHASTITQGCNIKPDGSGVISFTHPVAGTRYRLNGVYLELYMCRQNGELFGFLAASVSTNANLTIVNIQPREIILSVNATTGITSTTLIRFPDKGHPIEVIGASTWDYKENTQTLALTVHHHSPQTIRIELNEDLYELKSKLNRYLVIFYLIPVVLAGFGVQQTLQNGFDPQLFKVVLGAIVATIIVAYIVIGFYTKI